MANKNLFSSRKRGPKTDMINEAGGKAYRFKNTHALAQLAATGCLSDVFYARADTQLDKVLELCQGVDPLFVAKTAVYARKRGYMKDMPALLCAYLSTVDPELLRRVFPIVIDNAKMLRNFVQIMRSGAVGRKSLGSAPKKLVVGWLNDHDDDTLFRASVGQEPSLADIIKMVHPTPETKRREALYGYLLRREYSKRNLPPIVKQFEKFKTSDTVEVVPNVPFQMLTSFGELDISVWKEIIKNAGWHMIRMNLNTFERQKVFEDPKIVKLVANKLRDEKLIRRSRVFPYQLLMAYSAYNGRVEISEALQDAMEISVDNVPEIEGQIAVFPDVSGSMSSAVTGYRRGATTSVRCVDVAALVASVFLHQNKSAIVIPFDTSTHEGRLNPRDSIVSNSQKLASHYGGGTNCSLPMKEMNASGRKADLILYVSDNQSWLDSGQYSYNSGTATMAEWKKFKRSNPKAKMVCLDIMPHDSTQAPDDKSIMNIGGFSDTVFDVIGDFFNGTLTPDHWVGVINDHEV